MPRSKKESLPADNPEHNVFEVAQIAAQLRPSVTSSEEAVTEARKILSLSAIPEKAPELGFCDAVLAKLDAMNKRGEIPLLESKVPFDLFRKSLHLSGKEVEYAPLLRRWIEHANKSTSAEAGSIFAVWKSQGVPRDDARRAWEEFAIWKENKKREGKSKGGKNSVKARRKKREGSHPNEPNDVLTKSFNAVRSLNLSEKCKGENRRGKTS